MGVITGYNPNKFISASEIYASVKRGLSSFTSIDVIDENEFPNYTMEVLSLLGNAVKKEEETILQVSDYKTILPEDFNMIHSAYRCDKNAVSKVPSKHLQNTISFENEITYEVLSRKTGCNIQCSGEKTIERIEVKQYFNEFDIHHTFDNPVLLRLSPNVKSKCADDSLNYFATSEYEISIDNDTIYTNFPSGHIYLKYYANPVDDEGIPLIVNVEQVKKAVEWYIKYRIFLNFFENDTIPNAQTKFQYAQMEYEKAMAEARYISKLPSFSTMINSARNKRAINKASLFSRIDNKKF